MWNKKQLKNNKISVCISKNWLFMERNIISCCVSLALGNEPSPTADGGPLTGLQRRQCLLQACVVVEIFFIREKSFQRNIFMLWVLIFTVHLTVCYVTYKFQSELWVTSFQFAIWLNGGVFVYKLNGCRLESCCSDLISLWEFPSCYFDLLLAVVIQCRVREKLFLLHIFYKKHQLNNHETFEIILHIRSDDDQSKERFRDAVNMFLNEYPNSAVRKENPMSRVTNTHHVEHPTKNFTTMLHQFCLAFCQMKRKKFHKSMFQEKHHLIAF